MDLQASINANQPEQTETIICMDFKYYNAAAKGKIEVFKDIIPHPCLEILLTPIKNTVLHIYITALNSKSKSTTNFVKEILKMCPSLLWKANAGSESTTPSAGSKLTTNFVKEILEICPSLLWQVNAKDETPLHIAARYGHDDIVDVLIKDCVSTPPQDLEGGIGPGNETFTLRNKQGDTALHEAVRYNYPKVVELLIAKDPDFSYPANVADETPLYIATERGFKSVVFKILDKCKSPMYKGPLGRTALHAAVIKDDEDMTSKILEKIEAISRKVDDNNWTPLHLAAYFDSAKVAKLLLDKDREVAYMKVEKGRTALHIAAQRSKARVMEIIVSSCPDCCELVDDEGWNVLHFAMKADYCLEDMINIIIKNSSLSNLLNEKNAAGDTPLHCYANSSKSANNFLNHPRVDKMAFNTKNLSVVNIILTDAAELSSKKSSQIWNAINPRPPRRVVAYEDGETKDKDKEKFKKYKEKRSLILQKAAKTHLLVATLITTVTFAACITLPGGFAGGGEGSYPGSALLWKEYAFRVFVLMDTISMVSSSSAVFIHLMLSLIIYDDDFDNDRFTFLFMAYMFILFAMCTMGVAFVMGTYAMLPSSWDLAFPNYIMGLTILLIPFSGTLYICWPLGNLMNLIRRD